jgi:hypothetical protein
MFNKEKAQLTRLFRGMILLKRFLLIITLVFSFNTVFAQKALKILKDDGSITYINASAVDKITFETPLAIGDTYQGGIIFYLDACGEHGLIAAASDQSTGIQWYNGSYTIISATGDSVGAGEENTILIEINQGSGSYAAKLCRDLILNGYSDWYLPSKYELDLMYDNLHNISTPLGDFASNWYWSSTEYNQFAAWSQNFTNGIQTGKTKSDTHYVRAVRAF